MFVIAEIGTGHLGDRSKARELIRAAAEAGADCAKFQVVFAEEIIHPLTGELDLPGGRVRLFDKFKEVEQDEDFYRYCKEETEAAGLVFLASPFGLRSAQLLEDLGSAWFKVASPELNHFPLLRLLKSFGRPVVLSSGVSRLEDIERAVELFDGLPVSLLHCITAYPAPPEEYNLRVLRPLSVLFGCPVGVSDHSMDPELVPVIGRAVGATLVEKHFCLSRQDPGLDDPIALDPALFRKMTKALRTPRGGARRSPARSGEGALRSRKGRSRSRNGTEASGSFRAEKLRKDEPLSPCGESAFSGPPHRPRRPSHPEDRESPQAGAGPRVPRGCAGPGASARYWRRRGSGLGRSPAPVGSTGPKG